MGIHRSAIMRQDRQDAADTKARNFVRKKAERKSRDARMIEKLKDGSLPYTPVVMSWLSGKLSKASTKITPEDVKSLTA